MLPLPPGGAAHLFFLAAVAALVGGLSAIERKGALQLMLSRPIVLAPILGWALGDARGGLVLGVLVSPVLALARAKCRAIELFALAESWHLGWAVAAACAVRAIRDPRAPALAAVCALTVIVITLAFRGPG